MHDKNLRSLTVRLSLEVERLRVSSDWYELMKSPDAFNVLCDEKDGSLTWMGYPVVLDDTISDIEFDFKTIIGDEVKRNDKTDSL